MVITKPDDRKAAVVSGGSRGLGRAVVERLLAADYRVATFSRKSNDFVAATAAAAGDAFDWQPLDITDTARIRAYVQHVRSRYGRIDLLVNNAGLLRDPELLVTMSPARVEELLAANLLAPVLLTQACARVMVAQRVGCIVNVSSINAIRGYRGTSVYAAAKAGLDGLTRSLARELGAFHIRVNSVVPGYFESDMTADVTADNRERILRRTPLGRLGSAAEIASSVLFLASPDAQFITGRSLVVDGGITC